MPVSSQKVVDGREEALELLDTTEVRSLLVHIAVDRCQECAIVCNVCYGFFATKCPFMDAASLCRQGDGCDVVTQQN